MVDKVTEPAFVDYYEVMHLHPTASADLVEHVFRKLLKDNHPDNGGNTTAMARLNAAHDVLKNPVARKAYDEQWRRRSAALDGESSTSLVPRPEPVLVVEPTLLLVDAQRVREGAPLEFRVCGGAGASVHRISIVTPLHRAHPDYRPEHWLSGGAYKCLEQRDQLPILVGLSIDTTKLADTAAEHATIHVVGGRQRVIVHVVVLATRSGTTEPPVVACAMCGVSAMQGNRFCRNCGFQIRCRRCSRRLATAAKFCASCGCPRGAV